MISIIIPVYNTKHYLESCVESILKQTYRDFEIIFVDDGSTDGSAEILDTFAEKDERIRVIHQVNAGVSSARNRGINEARGDYLSFVDSDDTLEPDMYETLIGLIEQYDVSIAHCSYNRVENNKVKRVGNSGKVYVQTREEALDCFISGRLFVGSCWTKLYAKELFNDVRFSADIKTSEDMLVNFQIFGKVDTSVFYDVCKYNYLISDTSSCINTPAMRRARDLLSVNRRMLEINVCDSLKTKLERRVLSALLSCYKATIYMQDVDKKEQQKLALEIKSMRERGTDVSFKSKFVYAMMRYCPRVYKFAYKIYDRVRVPNYDV
ncbi:MAG: glycosyltransferase [Oscillospiraceae bacterium]|nr:glycosyltransferase [Oscillospiraceae bacterium]